MRKLEKWTSEKTYMYPNGQLAMPFQINQDFPAALQFAHVIETDDAGEICYAVQNLSALKSMYNIDSSFSDGEAIKAIEVIINELPAEQEPSTEERIAAAMEFQNMLALSNL